MKIFVFCIIAGVKGDFSLFFRAMDIDPDSWMNLSQIKTVTSSQMKTLTIADLADMLWVDIESRFTTNLVTDLRYDINNLTGDVSKHQDLEHEIENVKPFQPLIKTNRKPKKNKSRKAVNKLRLRMFNQHHRNNGRKQQ